MSKQITAQQLNAAKIEHAYMVLSRGCLKRMLDLIKEDNGDLTCGIFDVRVVADLPEGTVQVVWNNWGRSASQCESTLSGHPDITKEIERTVLQR